MQKLDRTHWQLLAALARDGALSAAAESLNITQSAASQRLREAERRLGVALVTRHGKRVQLDAAGERIARAAETALQGLAAAEADAIWIGRRRRARLRVALGVHDGTALALALSQLVAEVAPGTDVEFVRAGARGAAVLVKRDEADVAVLPAVGEASGLDLRPLFEDRLVAVLPPEDDLPDPVSASEISRRRYITYGLFPEDGWEYERFFRAGQDYPAEIVKVESTELICAMVARGDGVSILPRASAAGAAASGRVRLAGLAGAAIRFSWSLAAPRRPAPETAACLAALCRAGPRLAAGVAGAENG